MDKYLNLGCSNYKLAGFLNVDLDPECKPDRIADATKLPFENNSFSFIFSGHLLEHIVPTLTIQALREWYRVLKPGGSVMCVTPDIQIAMEMYSKKEINDELFHKIVYANGDHLNCFTQQKLLNTFKQVFNSVNILDLYQCPYLLVSNINNPIPDKWQSGIIALKL